MADLSLVRSSEASSSLAPAGFVHFSTITEAINFAQFIAKSDLVPKAYQNKPADIVIAMQMGMELGFSPLQALQSVAVINGKPGIYGDGIPALIIGQPDCEDFHEQEPEGSDPTQWVAVCTITRRGKTPVVRRFGYEDAKKAGLWGKSGPWSSYPKRMLMMRARGFAARDAFPDRLKGIITVEEAADYPTRGGDKAPAFTEPKRLDRGASVDAPAPAPAETVPSADATTAPAVPSAPTPVVAPPAVAGEQTMTGVTVLNSTFSRDKDDKPIYEFQTSEGLFLARDNAVYAVLSGIEGSDHTATIVYRIGRKGGQPVRAVLRAEVEAPVVEGELVEEAQ